ncbi:MAG: cadmium-translocating P-type ATPase [Candidatus Methanomethylophilaceae archaeon]|nr:cadmium-translocating P-type ATPase [Candidatus Methanomethylophilaceae archaeon]
MVQLRKKQKKMLYRIVVAAVLTAVFALMPVDYGGYEKEAKFFLFLIPYVIIGYDILIKAAKGIRHGQALDENFLMAIATIGAMVLGVTYTGDYDEAVAVMIFYQIGELFQSIAVDSSRASISKLMEIRPDSAFVEEDGELVEVDPDEVEVGTVIVVRPGERIPIDGVVVGGSSSLNTSALTGESIPRDVMAGDEVLSGCINLSGVLKIETTKEFGESTVSKILDMVENASSRKSRSEAFITRFAKVYTPFVVACALLLAVVPTILAFTGVLDLDYRDWIYRALTFLVISCPCALVISIPLGFFAGLGGASREGVLIKGSNYLEMLSEVDTVVFDKTGTLTQGVFEVTDVMSETLSRERLIELAAAAESSSPHPIAASLVRAHGMDIDRSRISDIEDIPGKGVVAKVDGTPVAVGNRRLMEHLGLSIEEGPVQGTIVHVAVDGAYAGSITISDVIKEESRKAMDDLKAAGIRKTVMLTGDADEVARKVAGEIGLDEVHSQLLPGDKLEHLERILDGHESGKVAFVGDGINDAPSLVRADIGITMGAIGSDAAIEASDVVIMDDDPRKIATAMGISRKTMRIIRQNIVGTLVIKFLFLGLSAVGIVNMWLAIIADVGVMIVAVLNSSRALRYKRRRYQHGFIDQRGYGGAT